MNKSCCTSLFAAALLALITLGRVNAAGLQVSPILLEFGADETAQVLWLSNSGSEPLRAQVRVQRWEQEDGKESLSATRDLAASPPLVEIAPGERQMIRVVRLDTTVPGTEMAYRLLVDELPSAPEPTATPGLQFLLQYSLPVFVGSNTEQQPRLVAQLLANPGEQPSLMVRNEGMRRARLRDLVFEDATGARSEVANGLLGYVLANESMQWPLAISLPSVSGTLKAMVNDEQDERELLRLHEAP